MTLEFVLVLTVYTEYSFIGDIGRLTFKMSLVKNQKFLRGDTSGCRGNQARRADSLPHPPNALLMVFLMVFFLYIPPRAIIAVVLNHLATQNTELHSSCNFAK